MTQEMQISQIQYREIEVSQIQQDSEIQIRKVTIDWILVDEYLNAAKDGAQFPPIIVFFDGETYWLADGNHRLEVAKRNGQTTINAEVKQGGKREAILYAVGANAEHGKPRTTGDKQNAVEKLLNDSEWQLWGDREIARRCKVSNHFVASLRPKTHTGNIPSMNGVRKFVHHKTGKPTTMNTNGIGKPKEPEPEAPQTPLFEAATEPAAQQTALVEPEVIVQEAPAEPAPAVIIAEPINQVVEPEQAITEPAYTVNVFNADSQYLSALNIDPVHLVVTSPPYNVGIDYAELSDDLSTYIPLVTSIWRECYKVMVDGARIAVVVPFGVGRNPYIPFDCQIMTTLTDAGFTLRGRIVWDKNTTGNRTSWGSFRLPSDPSIRDTTECIIVAHKGQSKLELPDEVKRKDEKGTHTAWLADSDEFMGLAQDHWVIAPESAQRIGHPAPFPVELAARLIRFYAYPGAHILDPFGGSGTVGIAAKKLGCSATLIELSQKYCELAKERLNR